MILGNMASFAREPFPLSGKALGIVVRDKSHSYSKATL
jgi:hypothetical protein